MPRQSKSSANTKAEHKRLRKLYLDTLTPARKQLELLDTLERDTRKAYKDGNIPESHYYLMLDNIAERRLLVGLALDKHEAKVKALTEYYDDQLMQAVKDCEELTWDECFDKYSWYDE